MRVILEIQNGPFAGRKIVLASGQLTRVGRTKRADFGFPHDPHMSSVHFVLECDEKSCRVRDYNSSNGTLVNGQKVSAAVLSNGDQISAGQTTFVVQVEADDVGASPIPREEDLAAAEPNGRLLQMLRGQFQPLFALLDAARDPRVLALLLESKEEFQSLYEGPQGDALAQFAPYLVGLPKESPLLETVAREGWGKSWGVYLTCDLPFKEVRKHFRHFLMAKLPDGRQVYFRFYDPRALRVYLPTCTAEEARSFFGPVKYYLMEGEMPESALSFAPGAQGAEMAAFSLCTKEADGGTDRATAPLPVNRS